MAARQGAHRLETHTLVAAGRARKDAVVCYPLSLSTEPVVLVFQIVKVEIKIRAEAAAEGGENKSFMSWAEKTRRTNSSGVHTAAAAAAIGSNQVIMALCCCCDLALAHFDRHTSSSSSKALFRCVQWAASSWPQSNLANGSIDCFGSQVVCSR